MIGNIDFGVAFFVRILYIVMKLFVELVYKLWDVIYKKSI